MITTVERTSAQVKKPMPTIPPNLSHITQTEGVHFMDRLKESITPKCTDKIIDPSGRVTLVWYSTGISLIIQHFGCHKRTNQVPVNLNIPPRNVYFELKIIEFYD